MKIYRLFLCALFFVSTSLLAETKCFILKENYKILQQEGECETRYAPESTFKIALSLMGYDADIFKNEASPKWSLSKEYYDGFINVCKTAHNPREWMRDSCVWYSRVLTKKLGLKKFKNYVAKFDYGNQDISGDPDENNGLTNAWLSSSLTISPNEQTIFVQKILDNKLAVNKKAYAMTKKILFREELSGGWKLYGKTGNGKQLNGKEKTDLQHGWFVGWIEKNGRKIVFANHIVDDAKQGIFASFRARDEAKNKLWKLIEELEK